MPETTVVNFRFSRSVIKLLKRMAYVRSDQLEDNRYGMGNAADDFIAFVAEKYPEVIGEFLGESTADDAGKPISGGRGERMLTDEDLDRYPQAGVRRVDQPRRAASPDEKTGTDG